MNWHKLKRWTLHLVMATISFDAFTQGQINFETAARVRNAQDGQTIFDEGFLAQIFVGPNQDPGQMKAVGGVVLVGTDGQLLTPSPNPRTLPDSPPGTEVFAQIRVWNQNDNFSFDAVRDNGGWLGTSQIFRVRLETTATTPLPQDTEIHVRKTVGNLVEFGQIAFANRGSGLDVPFLGTDGKPLEGDNYLAQLFVGPSPELLNPIPEIRTFGTGNNA